MGRAVLVLLPLREKVPAGWQADEGLRKPLRIVRPLIRPRSREATFSRKGRREGVHA